MFFIHFYPREYDKYGHVTINVEGNILYSQNIPTAKRDWVILYKRCHLSFNNQIFKQHILVYHHTPNHGSCLQVKTKPNTIMSASPLSHIFTNPASNLSRPLDGWGWTASWGNSARGHWGPSWPADFWAIGCEKLISALSYPDHWLPRCLLACFLFTFSRFSYLKGLHNSTQNLTQDHLRWRYHRWLLDT